MLNRFEELVSAAQDGPWIARVASHAPRVEMSDGLAWGLDGHSYAVWTCDDEQDGCPEIAREWIATAQFIAASRDMVPKLLAAVQAAKTLRDHYGGEARDCDLDALDAALAALEAP